MSIEAVLFCVMLFALDVRRGTALIWLPSGVKLILGLRLASLRAVS